MHSTFEYSYQLLVTINAVTRFNLTLLISGCHQGITFVINNNNTLSTLYNFITTYSHILHCIIIFVLQYLNDN